jgi:hypothetical protein
MIKYQLTHPDEFNLIREIQDRTSPARLKKRQRRKSGAGVRAVQTWRFDRKNRRLYHGSSRENKWVPDKSAWITVSRASKGVTTGEIRYRGNGKGKLQEYLVGLLYRHFSEEVYTLQLQFR